MANSSGNGGSPSNVIQRFTTWLRRNAGILIGNMIVTAVTALFITWISDLGKMPNELEKVNTAVLELDKSVSELKTEVSDVNTIASDVNEKTGTIEVKVDSFEKRVLALEAAMYDAAVGKLSFTAETTRKMSASMRERDNVYYLSSPTWKITDVIATDAENGEEYTADKLVGKKLLIPYENEGQEIVFYGQFNEKNQWDGNCLLNVYKNNNLILATEAVYEDGEMISYCQIFENKGTKEGTVWTHAERRCMNDYNSGDSWDYAYDVQYVKDFLLEEASEENIVYIDSLKGKVCKKLIGHYYGNTSDGKYNDTTGNAYLIRYNDDGTVRLLYQGKIKDGFFEDDTNEAWYIVKEENTKYMYYKGQFKGGGTVNNEGSYFENDLTIERINEILEGENFKEKYNWKADKEV